MNMKKGYIPPPIMFSNKLIQNTVGMRQTCTRIYGSQNKVGWFTPPPDTVGGFTLLEMLIALSIFSVVIILGAGALVMLQAAQSHAINLQNVHDNIRFTLETMSREIRTSDSYCNGASCMRPGSGIGVSTCDWPGGGSNLFSFRQSLTRKIIAYRLYTCMGTCGRVERKIGGGDFLPITDPDRTVTNLTFYTTGSIGSPQRVTILLEVEAGDSNRPGGESRIRMQTSVTKRRPAF